MKSQMTAKPFFPEPFDLAHIATVLQDDKFYPVIYALMNRARWDACAAQLPELFLAFMREGIPDHRLYRLAAIMFQWTYRFFDGGPERRRRLVESLDFIDQEKWVRLCAQAQVQDSEGRWGWRHPWRPWDRSTWDGRKLPDADLRERT